MSGEELGTVRALCFSDKYLNSERWRNADGSIVLRSGFSSMIKIVMFFPANVKFLETHKKIGAWLRESHAVMEDGVMYLIAVTLVCLIENMMLRATTLVRSH